MFDAAYRRAVERHGPSEEQMERMVEAVLEGGRSRRTRGGLRTLLLAAALCAVLGMTALAVSPGLREALAEALGNFGPYSREVQGLSVVDQGIEVRVVSALSDGTVAQVYYEIQDLAGDRLDEFTQDDLMAPMPRNWGEEKGPRWTSAGSTDIGGLVKYDEVTKTALMVGAVAGNGPPAEELILGVDIREIQPGKHCEGIPVDPEWIGEGTMEYLTLESGKQVLAPEQNPRALDSEFFSLSAFGFGEDGMLHLQVRVKEGLDDSRWVCDYDDVRYSGGRSIAEGNRGGPRSARYLQSTDYKGMTKEEMELAAPETRFRWEGVTYYDMRTGITPADVAEGDVEWDRTIDALLATCPPIRGEWKLTVPVEMVEKVRVDMAASQTRLAGVTARALHLSVLGAVLESDPNGAAGTLGYPLTLYLTDGRVMPGMDMDRLFHAGGYAVNHWTFPEPVEPEDIAAVAIGMWYVPIQDGAAQPGHWLESLPTP